MFQYSYKCGGLKRGKEEYKELKEEKKLYRSFFRI
jgi:hypothetical protein